jgi:hypothetical protein
MILVQQEKFKASAGAQRRREESEPARAGQMLVAIYSQLQDYPHVAENLQRLISMSPQKKQY